MSRASRSRSTRAHCVTVCCHTEGLSAGGLAQDLDTEPPRHRLCVTVFSCRFFLPFCHRPLPYGSSRVHFKLQYFVYYCKLISARDFKINCRSEDRHGVLGTWWCGAGKCQEALRGQGRDGLWEESCAVPLAIGLAAAVSAAAAPMPASPALVSGGVPEIACVHSVRTRLRARPVLSKGGRCCSWPLPFLAGPPEHCRQGLHGHVFLQDSGLGQGHQEGITAGDLFHGGPGRLSFSGLSEETGPRAPSQTGGAEREGGHMLQSSVASEAWCCGQLCRCAPPRPSTATLDIHLGQTWSGDSAWPGQIW